MLMLGFLGAFFSDLSPYVTACTVTTDEHGYGSLTATIPRTIVEAFRMYDQDGVPQIGLYDGAFVVWEGRVEDPGLWSADGNSGITIAALGYWQALGDVPYTALWSDTKLSSWRIFGPDEGNTFQTPERFETDTNNRLFITPKKGESFGFGAEGSYVYYTPDRGSRNIVKLEFAYNLTAIGSAWKLRVVAFDTGYLNAVEMWGVTGTGLPQSGTAVITLNRNHVWIGLQQTTGGGVLNYAPNTGDNYAKLTNVRVSTTFAVPLGADEIARALVAHTNTTNPSQLSNTTALIESPGVDLTDENYEDLYPSEILTNLAARGDNQNPPRRWEVGVWEQKQLHFRPRGSASTAWYVDATEIDLERTLAALYNSTYAVYEDASGRTQRTAIAADPLSNLGIIRRQAVQAKTTSAAAAGVVRDAALNDTKAPLPRADIVFTAVYNGSGIRAPLWRVRSGDTITIRNLPPTISIAIDRLRTFRITRTTFDAISNTIKVVPEAPLPTIAAQLADR